MMRVYSVPAFQVSDQLALMHFARPQDASEASLIERVTRPGFIIRWLHACGTHPGPDDLYLPLVVIIGMGIEESSRAMPSSDTARMAVSMFGSHLADTST